MKKFKMLIFTLVMMLLTTISYAYENFNIKAPEYKKPSININSSKFGEIKNISWVESNSSNTLLILSSRNKNNTNFSYLYALNIDNGDYKLIYELPSHKILNDIVLYDDTLSSNDIITAFDKGIVKSRLVPTDDKKVSYQYETLDMEGFDDVNSMDYKGNLYYTKTNDSFIYIKQLYRQPFAFMNNQNSPPDLTKHYKKPYYIVSTNNLDSNLIYTSLKKDGINLYAMSYNGTPISKLNTPLVRNVVTATDNGYYGHGSASTGMNLKGNSTDKNLNIFMAETLVNDKISLFSLDTIPFNLDRFGAIPSIDSIGLDKRYCVVYTSYNESHKGQLKLTKDDGRPKVILEDDDLYGPVIISRRVTENSIKDLILYFTYENNQPHAKICDIDGNLVKDITNMLS